MAVTRHGRMPIVHEVFAHDDRGYDLNPLIEPLNVMPGQLASTPALVGEELLAWTVLWDGVSTALGFVQSYNGTTSKKMAIIEARRWMDGGLARNPIFSFTNLCDHFGINAQKLKELAKKAVNDDPELRTQLRVLFKGNMWLVMQIRASQKLDQER